MNDEIKVGLIFFAIGLFFGFIFGAIFVNVTTVEDLGTAICKEEYNMEYKGYIMGELVCETIKQKEQKQYDGLVVNLFRSFLYT